MTIDCNGFPTGDHDAEERIVQPRHDSYRVSRCTKPRIAIGPSFGGWGPKLG